MTTVEAARVAAEQAAVGDPGSRLLERLVTQVGGHARVQAVFGDPVERAEITVIPVARVRWGVGGGGGEGPEGGGAGGGGGVAAEPIGYIEITAGGATFRPISAPFGGPLVVLTGAIGVAIIVRALGRLRR